MIIFGLGNPGEEYELTRHNLGRLLVERVAVARDARFDFLGQHQALVARGGDTTYVLPETFMNRSGDSVRTFLTTTDEVQNIIVIYDDIDLPFGKLRISFGRGSGGHNGVESIIGALCTTDFVRVRIGIAPVSPDGVTRKPEGEAVADFVLKNFGAAEKAALPQLAEQLEEVLSVIMTDGYEVAMNRFNGE